MSYIGNTPTTQSFISGTDYFNGTGAQTAFTLSRTVASVNDIQAVVNNVVQVPNDAYTISGTTITFTSAPSAGTQNVYVRYLSTTTQAITPSQGTVSWSTLDSNVQGDLGISFKNRIINSNMAIDQRNAGAAVTTSGSFPVDRFYVNNSSDATFSAQQSTDVPTGQGFVNSLKVTYPTGDASIGAAQFSNIQHNIEGFNVADLGFGGSGAKSVTLSFWVKASVAGQYSYAIYNSAENRINPQPFTINSANTWEFKSITYAGDTTGTWLTNNGKGLTVTLYTALGSNFLGSAGWNSGGTYGVTGQANAMASNGNTFAITGVQLEVGTQATTFTTAGGSYGAELALCQRYYWKMSSIDTGPGAYACLASGIVYTPTGAQLYLKYPVAMRAGATFVGSNLVLQTNGGNTVNSPGTVYPGTDTAMIQYNSLASSTQGYGAILYCNGSASYFLSASAEL